MSKYAVNYTSEPVSITELLSLTLKKSTNIVRIYFRIAFFR